MQAYRRGGDALIRLDRPVHRILVDEGIEGLVRLPGIGESLARSIIELVYTGDLGLLGRLWGAPGPAKVLSGVPGPPPSGGARIPAGPPQPPVSELLDVDREYREKAETGVLPRSASRPAPARGGDRLIRLERRQNPYPSAIARMPLR